MTYPMPKVAGECPMGCGATLFLGSGGHVTCSLIGCPRPTAADELLHLTTDHAVIFDDHGWTVEHPARERLDGAMHLCALHQHLRSLDGAPVAPGRYRVAYDGERDRWTFTPERAAASDGAEPADPAALNQRLRDDD